MGLDVGFNFDPSPGDPPSPLPLPKMKKGPGTWIELEPKIVSTLIFLYIVGEIGTQT